jgi:hypothetical protein
MPEVVDDQLRVWVTAGQGALLVHALSPGADVGAADIELAEYNVRHCPSSTVV